MDLGQQLEVVRPLADLLGQLAGGRHARVVLALDVAEPGRDLQQLGVDRAAVLADEQHRAPVVEQRHHGHDALVADDVALEGRAVGCLELRPHDRDAVQLGDLVSPRWRNPAISRFSVAGGGGEPKGRALGHRVEIDLEEVRLAPSARSSAAPTNSRNSGAGRSGRLLNSGWACVPTQNGWSSSSMNSTSRPSGDVARAAEPGGLEPAAVPRVELVAVAVPLGHDGLAVDLGHLRAGLELGDAGAEAHRAAHVGHVALRRP